LPGGGIRGYTCRHGRKGTAGPGRSSGAAVTEGTGAVRIGRVEAAREWPTGPAGPTAAGHRAVQQDIAVTVVDWPVVHAWAEDDPDFVGAVTVLDHAERQLATADWAAPTDDSADRSLSGMGMAAGRAVGTGLAGPADRAGDPGSGAPPAGRPMTPSRALPGLEDPGPAGSVTGAAAAAPPGQRSTHGGEGTVYG